MNISIHALLAESDVSIERCNLKEFIFLSTLSLRRATLSLNIMPSGRCHFYPRSPCGERPVRGISSDRAEAFLSTLSLRRATRIRPERKLPMRISIHALLAESDNGHETTPYRVVISIHALLAESDDDLEPSTTRRLTFLSTLSLRRATTSQVPTWFGMPNFYPRSPCGERQAMYTIWACTNKFLSTLSLRRATFKGDHGHISGDISIHALLAESDTIFAVRPYDAPIFLSTLSLRRATLYDLHALP